MRHFMHFLSNIARSLQETATIRRLSSSSTTWQHSTIGDKSNLRPKASPQTIIQKRFKSSFPFPAFSSPPTKWRSLSGHVAISLDNDVKVTLNAAWLRENCLCERCYNRATNQRIVLFHHLDPSSSFQADNVTQPTSDTVTVTWADGHVSKYGVPWISLHGNCTARSPPVSKLLWDANIIKENPVARVHFDELMKGSEGRRMLLQSLVRHGVGFVDGAPATLEGTLQACGSISPPLRTLYGDSWVFGNNGLVFEDTAYTNLALGAHTDGTYYLTPPGIQVLHCLGHASGSGGESLLVDGFQAARTLLRTDPASFRTLTRASLDHRYLDASKALHSHAPVLKQDPLSHQLEWIRYNPYDRSDVPPAFIGLGGGGSEAAFGEKSENSSDDSQAKHSPAGAIEKKLKPGQADATTSLDEVPLHAPRYQDDGGSAMNSKRIDPAQVGRIYEALGSLARIIEAPESEYWFKLQPGTVLLVDNWRVMHGRAAFTGTRNMCGCYLARDEWVSEARRAGLL